MAAELPDRMEEIRTAPTAALGSAPHTDTWVTAPPDFVGIGVQRAGTTRWYRLITDHPRIARRQKEVHFFDRGMGVETIDHGAYHAYFSRPAGLLAGEWTPRYMADPWTAPLLAQAAPEAKLLVALRDPVERFRSALAWRLDMSDRGLATIDQYTYGETLARSHYLPQLRNVLRHFSREQLLVLQFERCVAHPAEEIRRTYDFLGVDSGHVPAALNETVLAAPVPIRLPAVERRRLVEWLQDDVRCLADDFPELDLALWPNFSHLA